MIGTGLRKFAEANGMKVSQGIAYGNLRGYAVSLCEGAGWKRMVISTQITRMEVASELQTLLDKKENVKQYRLNEVQVLQDGILVPFRDTVGTMKCIEAFTDWFFPVLDGYGLPGYNTCSVCGAEITGSGSWKLVGDVAYHVHESCGERMEDRIRSDEEEAAETDTGNYATGFVGALVGALLGAVVWAIVMKLGYIAGIVGFLCAFFAVKGYDLLHGKQGKAKTVIVALCAILAVFAGNYAGYLLVVYSELISQGALISFAETPALFAELFAEFPEFRISFLKDLGIGTLFGILGAIGMIIRTAKSVSRTKISNLE